MSKLRTIVFDFDGVVLETGDVKTDAFVELYASHGPAVTAKVRAHHMDNLGVSRFKKFSWIAENIFNKSLSDEESKKLGDRFSDLVLEKVLAAAFVPGADKALAELAQNYPLFVASGTPQDELNLIVSRRGLEPRFREVHGTPREKPEILRDLMARNQWTPDEVLFVGDGMSDYKAAVAAGTQFLARDTPALHDEWVRLPVRRLPDLTGLADLVSTW